MPNPKGKPENFNNPPSQDLTETVTFRTTKEMKDAIKAEENPGQFCRDAIQDALDKKKQK